MKTSERDEDEKRRSNTPPADVVQVEAATLKALFEQHQQRAAELGGEVSQASFGHDTGIGVQGMVWQYLNGRKPLNIEAAMKFASGLGVPIDAFSPRLAEIAVRAAAVASATNGEPATRQDGLGHTVESVKEITRIPLPFDQASFDALSPEQQQDIAQVAALLTGAFARHGAPPTGEAAGWESEQRPSEEPAARGKHSSQNLKGAGKRKA